MSKLEKSSASESKPGCSRNGHIIHMIFCFFLFLLIMQDFNPQKEPISIFFFSYSVVGLFYSFYMTIKLSKKEKQEKLIKQFRELDLAVLNIAKENGGYLTPAVFSLQASVSIEEAKQILDKYIERGIAQIEVTNEGIVKYVFPELIASTDKNKPNEL